MRSMLSFGAGVGDTGEDERHARISVQAPTHTRADLELNTPWLAQRAPLFVHLDFATRGVLYVAYGIRI